MSAATHTEIVSAVGRAKDELGTMARAIDTEVVLAARAFEGLAGHANTIISLAAGIVECVESEGVSSVLPKVQALGAAARRFIEERLHATTGILETVTTEVKLLRQLSEVAGEQEAIALEIKSLSMLTNIEVARLGAIGAGFSFLASELSQFSTSVIEDTIQLASHTLGRKTVIEETRRALLAELPRLREEFARIDADLGNALAAVDASLTELSRTPAQFRVCVENIAQQIAAVVAAIQTHDITRQMDAHVQQALAMLSARLLDATQSENGVSEELPFTYAGLTVQTYQLRLIDQTVAGWISQIRKCMSAILTVSTSDVVGIGPAVLEQERKLSLQLAGIEQLERESQVYSGRIQHTLAGLSTLMRFVSEHLQRSKSIRDRLRLLAFNSIIEASHLGTQADAILAISKSIKEISAGWSKITDQSEQAMKELLKLVKQTDQVTEAFSTASNERLREAEVQTRVGLENLRGAAEFAASQAQRTKTATDKMQTKVAEIAANADRLDVCFGRSSTVLSQIEQLRRTLRVDQPDVGDRYDAAEVEQLFAASYTTELERAALHAALSGAALPVAQQNSGGNSVELF